MTVKDNAIGSIVFDLPLFGVLVDNTEAENSSKPDAADPCADLESLKSDDKSLNDFYHQARLLCEQRKLLSAISDLDKTEKYIAIATAAELDKFGSVPVKTGASTSLEKVGHIGAWQAQQTLFDAAISVGAKVRLNFLSLSS